jgi:hypothetical protein
MKSVIMVVVIVKLIKPVNHYFPHEHAPTPNVCTLDFIPREATRPRAKLRGAIITRSPQLFMRKAIRCNFIQVKNG